MSEDAIKQLILAFENYLSGSGFGLECERAAQLRGWLDHQGRATEAGRHLCQSLADQTGTRTVFRNCA